MYLSEQHKINTYKFIERNALEFKHNKGIYCYNAVAIVDLWL